MIILIWNTIRKVYVNPETSRPFLYRAVEQAIQPHAGDALTYNKYFDRIA